MPGHEVEIWHNGTLDRILRVEDPRAYIHNFNRSDFARERGWEATLREFPLPKVRVRGSKMTLEQFTDWLFEEHNLVIDIIPAGQDEEAQLDTKH